jgi:hypothetical protein
MENEKMTIEEIINEYNNILKEAGSLNYYVRDIDLQKNEVINLESYLNYIHSYKRQAQTQEDETSANMFFQFQCVINAILSSLQMWIALKENSVFEAWDHLIEAQEYVSYAQKVPDGSIGLIEFSEKLKMMEITIFPRFPIYSSLGLIIKGGKCSICGKPLEHCPHVEDELYCGSICKRINVEKLEINHSAIVKNPKDRRCVIKEFEFKLGKMYDYMTLKFIKNKTEQNEGKNMKMVLFNNKELDIF